MPRLLAICLLLKLDSRESRRTSPILRMDNLSCDMTSSFWRRSSSPCYPASLWEGGAENSSGLFPSTVSFHAGHLFRKTQKSGRHPTETGGHHPPKWVAIMGRNEWPSWAEIRKFVQFTKRFCAASTETSKILA